MESYNLGSELNEGEFDYSLPPLRILDPQLYFNSAGGKLEDEFICTECTGVVIHPVECKSCNSLFCKICSQDLNIPCPK